LVVFIILFFFAEIQKVWLLLLFPLLFLLRVNYRLLKP